MQRRKSLFPYLKFISFVLLALFFAFPVLADVPKPKLIVLMVIDGLSQEQLEKMRPQFGDQGFNRLIQKGAYFTQTHYPYSQTVTASGHASLMTGVSSHTHGILHNEWIDRQTLKKVYSAEDTRYHYLGEQTDKDSGTSPSLLRVPTLGDLLRESNQNQSRVFGASIKDRAAILMAGKTGTAYFYHYGSGRFTTSDYYMKEYPEWMQKFRDSKPEKKWKRQTFLGMPFFLGRNANAHFYLLEFVKAMVTGENVGHSPSGATDMLLVSFSSHDSINHRFGPQSEQSAHSMLYLDRALAEFLQFLDQHVGFENLIFILSSDHGFLNVAEYCDPKGISKGMISEEDMLKALNEHLEIKFGKPKSRWEFSRDTNHYAFDFAEPTIFLNYDLIRKNNLSETAVENSAKGFLENYPGIFQVFTRTELKTGAIKKSDLGLRAWLSWDEKASGDLYLIQDPCWYFPHPHFANHGSPHDYDTHVPMIWAGDSIPPGQYAQKVTPLDIVPTLAEILGLPRSEIWEGKVLSEVLKEKSSAA